MRGNTINGERLTMLCLLALGLVGCLLPVLSEPPAAGHDAVSQQALDLVRLATATCLTLSLLLGPGVAWRILGSEHGRRPGLGFLPLPGFGLLTSVGGLAWALSSVADPKAVCCAVFVPVLAALLAVLLATRSEEVFDSDERRTLLIVGSVLGLAVGRALWSLGPEGELYGGTISRTLEVGDRSDSRISYIIPTLVANGGGPYGDLGNGLFAPYNFSSRGPLPGLASAPTVLISGGRPPGAGYPEQPWAPFDAQGFMAYRVAMMAFACTAFVSLWDLTRRIGGRRAANLALLLAATTPFLVHEVWFTWPKMLAASMVLLAGLCVVTDRPLQGGLLAGLGYLMHPSALVALPVVGLLALWPLRGAIWSRPRISRGLLLAGGLAVSLVAWRLLNGSHYDQTGFLEYLKQAGLDTSPSGWAWLHYRGTSVANTVVPLLLPLDSAADGSINVVGGTSPSVVHFFFQYWNTLPFGVAIVFFPLLLASLYRAARRWPWPFAATVAIPFVLFAIYWGASSTGMMREGLQLWALTLFVVVGCEQAARGFPWQRSTPIRAILALRVVEVLAVALIPTIATRHELLGDGIALTDATALCMMLGFGAYLASLVWSTVPPPDRSPDPR